MKKTILLLTLLLLTAALALTACGQKDPDTSKDSSAESTPSEVMLTAYDHPENFVNLPALDKITVSDKEINKEVDSYIQNLLGNLGREDYKTLDKSAAAILGDRLNIHYTGRAKDPSVSLSAEALAGMTNATDTAGYDLVLGSGSFISGFEEQLVGAKEGDTITVDVAFPDDYRNSEELRGVAVLFEVKVNSVSRATISEKNVVIVSVLYSLIDDEEKGEISDLLGSHEVEIDFRDSEELFDEFFASDAVKKALLGKSTYGTAEAEVTLSAKDTEQFGYDHALKLKAMLTVEQILFYPDVLTDEEVESFTGGGYKDVASFRKYIYDHYRSSFAYEAIKEAASFNKMPDAVYDELYKGYYDSKIYSMIGDISGMTEEELAERLTEEVKKQAENYADENATAEFEDRMLIAYLGQILNFTMTDETYDNNLKEMYDYYLANYYFSLIYSGITNIEEFESYFGKDNLHFQFTTDEIITQLGDKVSTVE